jgi:ubiquinone biosynthesis protein COQ4
MADTQETQFTRRMQPIIAWRAMKKLLADKEQTEEVFVILRALGGAEMRRNFKHFEQMETGKKILAEERDIILTLNDRDALAAMPEGSLGRRYLAFVISEGLTADGLVDASNVNEEAPVDLTDDEIRFQLRLRDTHDLWHVTTDYKRDGLGELCLLAFTYAQSRNKGLAFIVAIATMTDMRKYPKSKVFKAVREGYRHGKQAEWFVGADWEALLPMQLEDVRKELGFNAPENYRWSLDWLTKAGALEITSVATPAQA